MLYPLRPLLAAGLLTCAVLCGGARAGELSEHDYFAELPEILTVTRLAQPLSDTPGAVTVIDRETIRRSGARELADVLRLVPGYLLGGFNGANPSATYHVPLDDYGIRNLVLVDGRPVYSAYYQGDTHRSMMGVLLDDIERIEVLRGSNSAAYGANALFGVINVITRHSVDTLGGTVSYSGGSGGIQYNMARIGWGDAQASFRISTGRRKDGGYGSAHDDMLLSQLHFRGDLRPTADQDLMLAAGVVEHAGGTGFVGNVGNPARTAGWHDLYLHGVWQRQLSATDQIKLSASFDEESFRDQFRHAVFGVNVSSSGRGRRANVELQHQLGLAPELRAVWGFGFKHEEALSPALYATNDAISIQGKRLFGNFEWRPHAQWLFNVGGFLEQHSWKGSNFSPRLMANFQILPMHTLRAGVTEAKRLPTLFELAADVRWHPAVFAPFPYRLYASTGKVGAEKLQSQEVGYFGNFRDWRLTLDVRGYIERMRDIIVRQLYPNPSIPPLPAAVWDFVNAGAFKTRGVEYQLRWKPLADTEIWLNQNFQQMSWDNGGVDHMPPRRATTLALFQKLPDAVDLSLMYHSIAAMSWDNPTDTLPPLHRLDARLAKRFAVGGTRAEAALVVQAANGSHPAYQTGLNFVFERRAFGTLRLEF